MVPAGGHGNLGGTPVDFELSGGVAVITGCSVGMGREAAEVLASEGVQTVVIARRGGLLTTLQDEVVAAGGPPLGPAIRHQDHVSHGRVVRLGLGRWQSPSYHVA